MPKAARTSTSSTTSTRKAPYSKPSPKSTSKSSSTEDKENIAPTSSKKFTSKSSTTKSKSQKPSADPTNDWRDIELEEKLGEVPLYDNASIVRRKLSHLLSKKDAIPHSTSAGKKWSQAALANEMLQLEQRMGAVEPATRNCNGPTVGSLGGFLKKKGEMGGGDSACYYWGYVLLEKLRVYNGERKSKGRVEAEARLPNGHRRRDPSTMRFWSGPGLPPPSMRELNEMQRGE